MGGALIPYSERNSFFLLDLSLKIHAMIRIVQQCKTSSAKAFRLFDEQQGEDGEKEQASSAEERTAESLQFLLMKVLQKTFCPHSEGWKSIFSQLHFCLQEYKCEDLALIKCENTRRNIEYRLFKARNKKGVGG